jgi:hypothetical protein
MTELPCAMSWGADGSALRWANTDWLIWMVSVAGGKFLKVTWPKSDANRNESSAAATEWVAAVRKRLQGQAGQFRPEKDQINESAGRPHDKALTFGDGAPPTPSSLDPCLSF